MKQVIHGLSVEANGSCIHYSSHLDIVANKCSFCQKFFACYLCHDSLENHKFIGFPYMGHDLSTMCSLCGREYSYKEYSKLLACRNCKSPFNPKCSLHKDIYCSYEET
ncbi:CHY zinc finger protein [Streptococcaceae bacterium ESL0729]|nr:CHY zinc finger protein [Streptococcaceae bacterium ESL0729]